MAGNFEGSIITERWSWKSLILVREHLHMCLFRGSYVNIQSLIITTN